MIPCSICTNKATYLFEKEKKVLCKKCINSSSIKGIYTKFVVHYINGKPLDFIKIKETCCSLINFKRVDTSLFDYLEELNKFKFRNKIRLLFFPNKEEANKFTRLYFDKDSVYDGESRYSLIFDKLDCYVLLNYKRLKLNEFSFLMN